ncbi:MAG: 3'(2'),5'-bisphosphate nucleotidase CysQ [Acetobacteraceae bacterium]
MLTPCPQNNAILKSVIEISAEAALDIIQCRQDGFTVHKKQDRSTVTTVDRRIEHFIIEKLRHITPDIPVIAEESVSEGRAPLYDNTYWLVDPIDGTDEFAAGGDDFAIHVGLVHLGQPVIGVVTLPGHQTQYYAERGHGAWRKDADGETRITCAAPAPERLRVVTSRRCMNLPHFIAWRKNYEIDSTVPAGSSIKFMQVAEGTADIYPRFTPSMEWDTAAPQAIIEEAGGSIHDISGDILRYGKAEWLNSSFICCSDHVLDRVIWA